MSNDERMTKYERRPASLQNPISMAINRRAVQFPWRAHAANSQFVIRHSVSLDIRHSRHAAFLAGCAFSARDLLLVFLFAPVSSRLFCKTETRSITLVGFGAFLGFSSISFPPASTFFSITSMSAYR